MKRDKLQNVKRVLVVVNVKFEHVTEDVRLRVHIDVEGQRFVHLSLTSSGILFITKPFWSFCGILLCEWLECEYEFVECERENGRAKKLKIKEGALSWSASTFRTLKLLESFCLSLHFITIFFLLCVLGIYGSCIRDLRIFYKTYKVYNKIIKFMRRILI